jgi:hypothetical protein
MDITLCPVIKAHHLKMHNIKEGHDVKASVGNMFVNYAEDFKKTKTTKTKQKKKKYFRKFKMHAKKNYEIP